MSKRSMKFEVLLSFSMLLLSWISPVRLVLADGLVISYEDDSLVEQLGTKVERLREEDSERARLALRHEGVGILEVLEELDVVDVVSDDFEGIDSGDDIQYSRVAACGYNYFNSFMSYRMMSLEDEPRQAVQREAHTDSEGFRRVGDRYVVAVASVYGVVGDYIKVEFSNGVIIDAVIGEIKGDTDCLHDEKSLLEYLVDYDVFGDSEWFILGDVEKHGDEVVAIYVVDS